MKNKQVILLIAFPIIIVMVVGWVTFDCGRRHNLPNVLIYPAAKLITEDLSLVNTKHPIAVSVYHSEDSKADVYEFYSESISCDNDWCVGDAKPYGMYYVKVDQIDSERAEITIETHWLSCTSTSSSS